MHALLFQAEQQEREIQLFGLTKQIRAMLQERKGLEIRYKNLNQELTAQNDHLEDMRGHKVAPECRNMLWTQAVLASTRLTY